MALESGTKLGPYEIVAPLGAGGMGEVYEARDTRLDRSVAIKVLPTHLSDQPELKERFEREARAVSSLNHPHICTLHDVGSEEGIDFLVMEHIEGETLAARLERGPLPLTEAVEYAIEIAGALEKAHRAGVVHRDLKPGNIMLTKSGPKLLDFGLAKLAEPTSSAPDLSTLSALPTEQKSLTAAGTVLGTFQYMAPEQLEGKDIDARTDIFALGAVIYEMVTGKRAFDGKTQASLISAIMSSEPPPMSTVEPISPPGLERLVQTCLAKDPDKRWQHAGDVARELEWIAEGGGEQALPAPARKRDQLVWAAVGIVAGIGLAMLAGLVASPAPNGERLVTRFAIDLGAGASWLPALVAVSPDSSRVAYIANDDTGQHLYVRRMDQIEPTKLPGTEGAISPFFSPDGQWVGFWADGRLQRVSVSGGLPVTLAETPPLRGAVWGEDDNIIYGVISSASAGLFVVPAGGGTPEASTQLDPDRGEVSHRLPDLLPNGDVVFTIVGSSANWIAVLSREDGAFETLMEGAVAARYTRTGHLVYSQGAQLLAVPFDADRAEITGAPVPMLDSVQTAQFAISDDGALFYGEGGAGTLAPEATLVWVDRKGVATPVVDEPGTFVEPRISPDGRRISLTVADAQTIDVWVLELARGTLTRVTFDDANDSLPLWTPDGSRISYSSDREAGWNVFAVPWDGSGQPERLTNSEFPTSGTSWSPDGNVLALQQLRPDTGLDIAVIRMGEEDEEIFLATPFNEWQATFSPDGRWLAYTSNESGREEVYVRAYPGPGGKWQISTAGGSHPQWSPTGREIFFRAGDEMMAVAIAAEETELNAGEVVPLFSGDFRKAQFSHQEHLYYDVSADGERFVMLRPVPREVAPTTLTVVLNWLDELAARVPTE